MMTIKLELEIISTRGRHTGNSERRGNAWRKRGIVNVKQPLLFFSTKQFNFSNESGQNPSEKIHKGVEFGTGIDGEVN